MSDTTKVFVLDTNVLLIDPFAIDKFEDNTVVVSMTVLEELDGLKKRKNTEYEARQAVNAILALTQHKKAGDPITLRNGGQFILDHGDIDNKVLETHELNPTKADNRILATAMRYRADAAFPNRVVIVSNDTTVRVKAHALALASEEYIAVNYKDELEDLYQAPICISLDEQQVNLWNQGKPIAFAGYNNQAVIVKLTQEQNACGFIYDEALYSYGANICEIIQPLNIEQELALQTAFNFQYKIVAITGSAGTGKTILALAVAIQDKLLHSHPGKIYIFRPTEQLADDMGYLPGNLDDKFNPHKRAIRDAYEVIQNSAEKLEKNKKLQNFDSLTNDIGGGKMPILPINFIRGSTLHNAYIIIDEAQNFSAHQMKTLLTRAGRNTRVIITGDPDQIDNRFITKRSCGLTHVIGKMNRHNIFAHVHLTQGERSQIASIAAELL